VAKNFITFVANNSSMNELKVLVSAYACNPVGSLQLHPGEDITGWRLVEQLSKNHKVWVITHSYNRDGVKKALAQGFASGIHFCFINLPSPFGLLYKVEFGQRIYYYLWQILAWKTARKLHRKFHFDLFHHLTFGNYWMPSFIGALLPIPFIWGPIGGGQKTPKQLQREYSLYGRFAERVRTMAQWIGRNEYFRRRCLKKARAILVCNRETKLRIPEKNKIYYFPVNGVSLDDINPESNGKIPKSTFRVLTAGRFHRLKGFALAIRSFKIFAEKFPNSEFIIVGKGPEESYLKELVESLRLQSKIQFFPWLSREKLLSKMRSSHVFLFPSFRDGGGGVVVEAMASGTPVICLDTAGPGFHVQEKWGIKIKPKDSGYIITEMAKALETLYLNEHLRMNMGISGCKRAAEFYLWDRLGERMQDIYQDVLDDERSGVETAKPRD